MTLRKDTSKGDNPKVPRERVLVRGGVSSAAGQVLVQSSRLFQSAHQTHNLGKNGKQLWVQKKALCGTGTVMLGASAREHSF